MGTMFTGKFTFGSHTSQYVCQNKLQYVCGYGNEETCVAL